MDQMLNAQSLASALTQKGLNQARVAQKLEVSREAVSKWVAGKAFPRPDKLLRLALLVGLTVEELLIRTTSAFEPVVAFRKKGVRKITEAHLNHAKSMGRTLSVLVPHLPYDKFVQPQRLKQPRTEYSYLQAISAQVRTELQVGNTDVLDFGHLVKNFNKLQAVLIPVLWGDKDGHENALHIYLPDSMTTWVYLNLDSQIFDFKFWMAHELGHAYAPDLRGNDAEDFADAFAGALLFPGKVAEEAYNRISVKKLPKSQVLILQEYAKHFVISPISVCKEINNYASSRELPLVDLGGLLFSSTSNFNKQFLTVSQSVFKEHTPTAAQYIAAAKDQFESPFFDALREYLTVNKKPAGFVQAILDLPLLDAKGIHAELS